MGLGNGTKEEPSCQQTAYSALPTGYTKRRINYGFIKVFRFEAKNGRTDYIGTSRLDLTGDEIKSYFGRRWSIEVMHRELKQTCGLGRCQARIGRAVRNHSGLSFIALVRKLRRRHSDSSTPFQQDWEVIKPAIRIALEKALVK